LQNQETRFLAQENAFHAIDPPAPGEAVQTR
jgi:hypothetical protein